MRALLLGLLLLLAGCGALPQPFFGYPGRNGALLAEPPPARLAVPTPAQSLLTDFGSETWARLTAKALADMALPASFGPARPGEWQLRLSATLRGQNVIPEFEVLDATGAPQGTAEGAPVPAVAWSQADEPTLEAAAAQSAPSIDALLTRIQAARLQADPNSLQNRPARVYVAGVTGAPGDGDQSLEVQIKRKLANDAIVVQDTASGADYRLHCEVHTEPGSGGQLKVELQWIVDDSRGERGRVVQLNEVPGHTLDRFWGDVAAVAAEQAAGGIRDVLFNAAGPRVDGKTAPAK
ncbi:MAG: hypothetical protein RQ966_10885 [Acetobacteraceae bacterium]|nr:hypothetical protein [Acetobacteraceae bacterium]